MRALWRSGRTPDRGRARAATPAGGQSSAGSFSTAAPVRTLIPTVPAVCHVSLTRGERRSRPNLVVHHGLEPADVMRVGGIPVTTSLRTLEGLECRAGAVVAAQLAAVLAHGGAAAARLGGRADRVVQLRVLLAGRLGDRGVGDLAGDDVDALRQPGVLA
jgi:hypothetical protein